MTKLLSRFAKNDSGATAIEYGLIAGILSISIITALTLLAPQLEGVFSRITAALTSVNAQ